mmetsp:Transcript_17151/g.51840  ORF Transcript_17151/g.51840 Transcript_17151/m.51840 type:complete len:82 (+) Transcript_17151:2507-2752(+)|eukprot:scaffold161343_cov31-Tisochrysis_lutea.AAC.3
MKAVEALEWCHLPQQPLVPISVPYLTRPKLKPQFERAPRLTVLFSTIPMCFYCYGLLALPNGRAWFLSIWWVECPIFDCSL